MRGTMRVLFAAVAVAAAMMSFGCSSSYSDSTNYSGTWVGSTSNLPPGNVLTFTLTHTDGTLTGSGTLTAPGEGLTGRLAGTVDGSDFTFQWDAVGNVGIGTTAIRVNGSFDSATTAAGQFVPNSGRRAGFFYNFTLAKK